MAVQRLARFGQRHLVQVAGKQCHAQLVFELLDALADGGLRASDALGRPGKRALFSNGEEVFQLQQVHGFVSGRDAAGYRAEV